MSETPENAAPAAPEKPKTTKTKAELEAELEAMRARLAELEGPVAEPGAEPTEKVTYFSKKRKHILGFPFRPDQQTFVQGPRGIGMVTTRHPRPAAYFAPDAKFGRGTYTTSDPEEIAYLDKVSNPKSASFNKLMLPKLTKREKLAV